MSSTKFSVAVVVVFEAWRVGVGSHCQGCAVWKSQKDALALVESQVMQGTNVHVGLPTVEPLDISQSLTFHDKTLQFVLQ